MIQTIGNQGYYKTIVYCTCIGQMMIDWLNFGLYLTKERRECLQLLVYLSVINYTWYSSGIKLREMSTVSLSEAISAHRHLLAVH